MLVKARVEEEEENAKCIGDERWNILDTFKANPLMCVRLISIG